MNLFWDRTHAKESSDITVRFSAHEEPDFRGSLSVVVIGFGVDNRDLFRTTVDFTVRD